jgi:hypothetical protein
MSIVWKGKPSLVAAGTSIALVESPTSPVYSFGDKNTCTRTFRASFAICLTWAPRKGATGTGILALPGYTVMKSTCSKQSRGIGELVVEYEASSAASGATLPPDKFSLEPFEVNPKVEQHQYFSALSVTDREKVRAWVDAAEEATRAENKGKITGANSALMLALGEKILKGVETFYMAGVKYTWTTSLWTVPALSAGGYVETPFGPMAPYLGTGFSWLREADSCNYTGSYYELTRSWMGGPSGHWDPDLYA